MNKYLYTIPITLFLYSLLFSTAGIGIAAFFVTALFLSQLFITKGGNDTNVFKTGLEPFLFGYILVTLLAYIFNSVETTPIRESFVDLRWILSLYSLIWILSKVKISNSFLKIFLIVLGIFGLYGVIQFFTGIELKTGVNNHPEGMFFRVVGMWGTPMTYAHSFSMLTCLLLALCLMPPLNIKKTYLYLCSILFALSVYLTLTRGVWIGMTIAFGVMFFIYRKKYILYLLIFSLIAIVTTKFTMPRIYDRAVAAIDISKNQGRVWIWKNHIHIWQQYPVLGIGAGENGRRVHEFKLEGTPDGLPIQTHAHNQVLDVLATRGLLGAICYLGFMIGLFIISINLWRKIPPTQEFDRMIILGTIGAQICLHVSGLTEANFEDNEVTYMAVFIFALVLWLQKKYKNKKYRLDPATARA